MSNRRKTLPPIDPSVDVRLRPVLEALKEIQETGEGVRGDPLDRKLTVRDLVNAGLAKMRPGSLTDITAPDDGEDDGDSAGPIKIPPRPAEFNAVGGFGYVVLSWKIPKQQYLNHAYTEIWRSETDNLANAEMVGQEAGSLYTDYVRVDTTEPKGFYYWIKYVSTDDIEGPYNDTAGTYAEVIPDLDYLIGELSADIDNSKLARSFLERLPGYQQSVSDDGDIYSLTLNQNGYISGIGAYNDGTTSDFAVIADRFWIAPPNSTGKKKPFIVQGGNVYIDTAFIRDASIQEGQIGPISFGKITDSYGNPVTTVAGKLKGDLIEADNLSVAEAAKFYGDNQSGNFRSGVRGWKLWQDGRFEIASGGSISRDVSVDGQSIGSIKDASSKVDGWTRPYSTLIDGNKIYTGDAYVDTLQIKGNAVTVPVTSISGSVLGDGTLIYMTKATISLDQPGDVALWFSIQQGYSSGGAPWKFKITRNGNTVLSREAWMTALNDYPSGMILDESLPAGEHTYRFYWGGKNSNVGASVRLFAMGVKR